MHVLNKRIIKAIIAEEEETAKRYFMLAKRYKLPQLEKASLEEASHARIFEDLLRRWK